MGTTKKTIFEYDNFRTYLKDVYEESKARDKKFSFRYFARIAGLKSPSSLKRVMDGERNLTRDGIERFSKALKLNKEEALFFKNLVFLNQATTVDQRQLYAKEILRGSTFRKIHPLMESQYNYYAHWYFIPIREMVALPGFQEDPDWIAKRLRPMVTPAEVKRALDILLKLGLLERDPEGKLVQAAGIVSTPDEVSSAFVAQYHREMSKKASQSIDLISREKREISSMTMGMSLETAKKIKEMIQNFRKEIIEVVVRDQGADTVYQLNFHLFPLAELLGEENK